MTAYAADTGAYVSAAIVKSIQDGQAPWDADNTDGNDTDDHNLRVRSFDYINYTLEYTTAITNEWQNVDTADIQVELTLPMSPKQAEFNMQAMNWLQNPATTYYYTDGTTSTAWNQDKDVTKQVLTGYRHLDNNQDTNSIPGSGTLSVGIHVKAATSNDTIAPSFKLWIDDTGPVDVEPDTIQVTSEPRYNIQLLRNTRLDDLAYFDFYTGDVLREDFDGAVHARYEMYGIGVTIRNVDADHGLKGIELPSGEITFDLNITSTVNGIPQQPNSEYAPLLWDYNENQSSTEGKWHRKMGASTTFVNSGCCYQLPYNSSSDKLHGCPSGGTFILTQDAADPQQYHIRLNNYDFDWENFIFPTYTAQQQTTSNPDIPGNVYMFSTAFVQIAAQFPRSVSDTENVQINAIVDNFHTTSAAGKLVTDEVLDTDNRVGFGLTLYAPGSISKHVNYASVPGGAINAVFYDGTAYSALDNNVGIRQRLLFNNSDNVVTAFNFLFKFDDKALYYPKGTTVNNAISLSSIGDADYTVLFAAKPDKSGWRDIEEMNATDEENLIYFDSLEKLASDGYTCVGMLCEVRNTKLYPVTGGTSAYIDTAMMIKSDPSLVGYVVPVVNDLRVWVNDTPAPRWEDETLLGDGIYGVGDASRGHKSYESWYTKPFADIYHCDGSHCDADPDNMYGYAPSTYEDGTKTGGHRGGVVYGDSCLLIGAKNSVGITIADRDSQGNVKTVYDLDNGERTVRYSIAPRFEIASANSEASSADMRDDLKVSVSLPPSIHYKTGSASVDPQSVETESDGSTTITWVIQNAKVGEDIAPITIACTIGAAGTPDDVNNNDAITASARITSSMDQRACTAANGNLSETTFSVVRLAATSIAKSVEEPLTELGEANAWTLNYGNSSDETVRNARIADVMPYNGDSRGSVFGGSYAVDRVVVDLSNAPDMLACLSDASHIGSFFRATTDAGARSEKMEDILNGAGASWIAVSGGRVSGNTIVFDNVPAGMSAFYMELGDTSPHEYASVIISMHPTASNGSSQQAGDVYVNNFAEYADKQAAVVVSNSARYEVVGRAISGIAWHDGNDDGIRDAGEQPVSGTTTATLYRTDRSTHGGNAVSVHIGQSSVQLYPVYDVYGNEVKPVSVGSDGAYRFDNLPSGEYVVVFTDNAVMPVSKISPQNIGGDDTVDSDALASIDNESGAVSNAAIFGIALPNIEDMMSASFESGHNDVGYSPYTGGIEILKLERDADLSSRTPLPGTGFSLANGSGKYIVFDGDGAATGSVVDSPEQSGATIATGADGYASMSGLTVGDYSLKETVVPDGYMKADDVAISIKPNAHQESDGSVSYNVKVTADGKEITASHTNPVTVYDTPAWTSLEIDKRWVDDNNRDGLRSDAVFDVIGTAAGTGEVVYTGTLTVKKPGNAATDSSSASLTDLPAYANGVPVIYTYKERGNSEYTTSASAVDGTWESGYTASVVNTHRVKMEDYSITKTWDDDNDRDGLRPSEIDLTLEGSDGSTHSQTVSGGSWSGSFGSLPVYHDEGKRIDYEVVEASVDGYVAGEPVFKQTDDGGWQITLTNTHETETRTISAEKMWSDDDDRDGLRPGSIVFVLTGSDGSSREATANAGNGWKVAFEDLPVYHSHGREIVYSVSEKQEPDGYRASAPVDVNGDGSSWRITNSHTPRTIDIPVEKIWDDDNNRDGLRTADINVSLVGSDGSKRDATLGTGNDWKHTFEDLPYYFSNGVRIDYSLTEIPVDGYTDEIVETVDDDANSFVITNKHIPAVVSIPATKVWDDDDDRDGLRPDSIHFTLTGSDGSTYEADFGSDVGYSGVFENLPVYHDGGKTIDYSLSEDAVDGYETDITESADGYGYQIVNTHAPDTRSIQVDKVWDDDDNRDGVRPDSVHIVLTGSDGSTREADVASDGGWRTEFSDLPAYFDHGTAIEYEVSEDAVDDYTVSAIDYADSGDGHAGGTVSITNTHEPQTATLEINKTWVGDTDADRPDDIGVYVVGDDGSSYEATLNQSDDGGWTATIDGAYVYRDGGTEVSYTVSENDVAGYDNILSQVGAPRTIETSNETSSKSDTTTDANDAVDTNINGDTDTNTADGDATAINTGTGDAVNDTGDTDGEATHNEDPNKDMEALTRIVIPCDLANELIPDTPIPSDEQAPMSDLATFLAKTGDLAKPGAVAIVVVVIITSVSALAIAGAKRGRTRR